MYVGEVTQMKIRYQIVLMYVEEVTYRHDMLMYMASHCVDMLMRMNTDMI